MSPRIGPWIAPLGVVFLVLLAAPFAFYAVLRGMAMVSPTEPLTSRLFHVDDMASTCAIYMHMIAGGLVTLLAPVQLLAAVRRRWPALHRASGYVVSGAAAITAAAGLWYILAQGTVGGPIMDVGFGLYGVLIALSVIRTVQLARVRAPEHRLWAERLVILVLGSWIYRVHYGLWDLATGGVGTRADFSGPFDVVQVFAFYLPYVLIHAWLWNRRGNARRLLA